mmetsp:Transcript_28900/g.72047  ORF Transcript_28900/g.72047 Transcript_28900/m.72047 type:complete len:94 (+) Transcript_28900:1002-1283(+)
MVARCFQLWRKYWAWQEEVEGQVVGALEAEGEFLVAVVEVVRMEALEAVAVRLEDSEVGVVIEAEVVRARGKKEEADMMVGLVETEESQEVGC